MLILERLGAFPGMSEKLRNGRNGEREGTILYAYFTIVIAKNHLNLKKKNSIKRCQTY